MVGLFGSLHVGTNGMAAAQNALQTTSHNLSNINTEGYSRQRINMEAENPYSLAGVGQLGTGVKMTSIVRVVDDYVTQQMQNENSTLSRYGKKSDILDQLESVFNEPSDTGLSNGFSKFYASWTYLSSNPELSTAKTMVNQQSQTLTDTVSRMATQLEGLHKDTVHSITKDVQDFNVKVEQLDTLNKQIFQVMAKGQTPNDLLDQRDRLVGDLTSIGSVEVSYDKFQRASITVDGNSVLNEKGFQKLGVVTEQDHEGNALISKDGTSSNVVKQAGTFKIGQIVFTSTDGNKETFKTVSVKDGSVRGAQEALEVVQTKKTELDQLVYQFATAVNTIHSDDGKGLDFFEVSKTDSAKSLRVKKEIIDDSSKINAGKSIDKVVSGDGTRAGAIAGLASTKLSYHTKGEVPEYDSSNMKFKETVGGSSTADAYNDMITSMGIVKQQADYMEKSQEEVLHFLKDRRSSISGVSMNEEVVDMMKFQSAFQANARIITVVNDMLDTLINRTGV